MHLFLADAVLFLHTAIVGFVVLGVPCIYIGKLLAWRWVRNYWLRVTHLLSIGIVTAQSWAGVICPLTTLEMWLREQGGMTGYTGSFIEHWLQTLLYWDLPAWVFIVVYSLFALLVVATWLVVPPTRREDSHE